MADFEAPYPEVLHLQIDTYEQLDGRPDAVEWVEAAARFVGPTRSSLAIWFAGAVTPRIRPPDDKAWAEARRRWADRELVAVSVGRGNGNAAALWSHGQIREGEPTTLGLGVRVETLPGGLAAVQPEVLRLLHDGAVRFGAATGFVYVDARLNPSGKTVEIEIDRTLEHRLREVVRGYYWATVLSAGHVERLGGYRRVAAEAPCARVTDRADERLVCLQLTESVAEATDGQLQALRDFLEPVLPGGDLRLDPTRPPPAPVRRPRMPGPVSLRVERRSAFSWDTALFTLVLAEPLDAVQEQGLRAAIEAWGTTAQLGGFGGTAHAIGTPFTTVDDGRPVVLWSADLGSADRIVIDRLVQMLERACSLHGIRPVKLVAG